MGLADERPAVLRWAIGLAVAVVGFSLVAGIAAAVVGGPLTDLGSGAGGLLGLPALLLGLAAVFLGIPASIAVARRLRGEAPWLQSAITAGGGLWLVAIGYFMVAHLIDPCVNRWWGPQSRIGQQPLCERFGNELNWHTRFHLVAHAAPAAALVIVYLWAVRRWVAPTTTSGACRGDVESIRPLLKSSSR